MVNTMGHTVLWLMFLQAMYPGFEARRNIRDTRILTKGGKLVLAAPDLRNGRIMANIRAFQATHRQLNELKVGRLLQEECPGFDSLYDALPRSDIQARCSLVLLTKSYESKGSTEQQGRFILRVADINDISSAKLFLRINARGRFTVKISTITTRHPANRFMWQALTDTYENVIEPRDPGSVCYAFNITSWVFMECLKSGRRAMKFAVDLRCMDDETNCMQVMDVPVLVTSTKVEPNRCEKRHRGLQPQQNTNSTGPDLREWKLIEN